MQEVYKALLELQELDDEIDRADSALAAFGPRLETLEAPVLGYEREVEGTRERLAEMRSEIKRLEKAADQKRERLRTYEERLNRVRNAREEAAARPEPLARERAHDRGVVRRLEEPHPDPRDEEVGHDRRHRAARAREGQRRERAGEHGHPEGRQPARAEAIGDPAGEGRRRRERDRDRGEDEAEPPRLQPEHAREEERGEEGLREHRRVGEEPRREPEREGGDPEDRGVEERPPREAAARQDPERPGGAGDGAALTGGAGLERSMGLGCSTGLGRSTSFLLGGLFSGSTVFTGGVWRFARDISMEARGRSPC